MGNNAKDFEGVVDGTGTKLSITDKKKLPMELVPACVLALTLPHALMDPNDAGTDPIACVNEWSEGGNDYLLIQAWHAIAIRFGWPVLLAGIAEVLRFGAQKYASDNWRRGIPWRVLVGAIQRHYYLGILAGEENDPETGLSHWYHIGCCLAFLSEYVCYPHLYGKLDNRFKRPAA